MLEYWYECYSSEPVLPNNIASCYLWDNKLILVDFKLAMFKTWSNSGINHLGNIVVDKEGNILSNDVVEGRCGFIFKQTACNCLIYGIPKYWLNAVK